MPARCRIPVICGGTIRGTGGRDVRRVVGEIETAALCERFEVPRHNHETGEGYQRPLRQARINQLAQELRAKQVDLPTAILLNLRDFVPSQNMSCGDDSSQLLLGDERLYVVDGQHRVLALEKLFTEDEATWGSFRLPFVCLLGATPNEELKQFYVVNSNAKSVPTDLAYTLLAHQAKESPEARTALIEGRDGWKVVGQEIAERLAGTEPWRGRIQFPSQKKTKQMTIPSSGMVNSLRDLSRGAYAYFDQAGIDQQVKILAAYWSGILRVLPAANGDPAEYTLQKMTGAALMHMVLPNVVELVKSQAGTVLDPDAYADVLEQPLQNLSGENRDGKQVAGVDFWRKGADGAAGTFSSNAGRRQLRARLLARLPQLTVR